MQNDALHKAEVLIDALGYIRKFRDRLTVIKLGGSVMDDPAALHSLMEDVVVLETAGLRPVLVHGGGKGIDRGMAAAGLQPKKIMGRRYTDDATLKIVVSSLLQDTNAAIVQTIRKLGGRAVGLHGGSLQVLFGKPMTLPGPDGPVDLGHVGNVDSVDVGLIEDFCAARVVPVIPSLAIDQKTAGWLNINADTAAAAVAAQLKVEKLVFLTDIPGILMNRHDPATLISNLNAAGCQDLIQRGIIDAGMIPKVDACLDCLRSGVRKTHMIDGRQKHAILLEIFTPSGIGTEIVL